jgi:hypothetical protein
MREGEKSRLKPTPFWAGLCVTTMTLGVPGLHSTVERRYQGILKSR